MGIYKGPPGTQVSYEFAQVGGAMQVTCTDSQTSLEVTILGPASAGQTVLAQRALASLNKIIHEQKKQQQKAAIATSFKPEKAGLRLFNLV